MIIPKKKFGRKFLRGLRRCLKRASRCGGKNVINKLIQNSKNEKHEIVDIMKKINIKEEHIQGAIEIHYVGIEKFSRAKCSL